ncbi:MAG: FMN-binding glutamate synthase family protein [Pseudarcicella sp.]|nr:FMN-binding glutamate synthase family protein [Pseudarcicella sp.]MBP6410587.1 FMN-binding glutamate synthase family protein [Pseudarcicella sp.]
MMVYLTNAWVWIIIALLGLAIWDITQKKHTILHNFPVIGHLRFFLESIGPEIRQYLVANNREELPFNRSERAWIYASSKKENNLQGFGSDQDFNAVGYIFIKHAMFGYQLPSTHPNINNPSLIPCAKTIGEYHKRAKPYKPKSIVNISGMSFGSLSGAAIEALNKGAAKFGAYHNTGEGSLSDYHKKGADVVINIGTAYFGVKDENGFSLAVLKKMVDDNPCIKALELKLSQGAKPGKGGMLPGIKVTAEIASIRKIPVGKDAFSPAFHTQFTTIPEMIDFIEKMAEATGLPVGIKSAVGKTEMWEELAKLMVSTGKGPDFITIDGGEGGTGAAPHAFADHVSLPFNYAFSKVYKIFKQHDLTDKIVFIGSGKLGFPEKILMAFSMGVDIVNVGREAMMSIGCIQAQLCHTNKCPSGVATNNKWLSSGLDPALKSERCYNYLKTLSKEVLEITHACGYEHPCQLTMNDVEMVMGDNNKTQTLATTFGYHKTPVPFLGVSDLLNSKFITR